MSRGDTTLIIMVLALFFLFLGEPDVWDVLHRHVMGTCK
jgi:hypothetical protein